jgi:hypothetical protein
MLVGGRVDSVRQDSARQDNSKNDMKEIPELAQKALLNLPL